MTYLISVVLNPRTDADCLGDPIQVSERPDDRLSATGSTPRAEGSAESRDIEAAIRAIQSGQSGNQHFQQLFRRYFPAAVHFFVRRGLARNDAEDLAQEVLLRVYRKVGTFRREASFETWLFQILTNVWKNALRRRATLEGRSEKIPLDLVAERLGDEPRAVIELQDGAQTPLDRIMADERTRLLLEAVDQLPPRMRQCMLLRVGQGLKYREIAEIMGVGVSSVKTHLGTAYERLKPLLDKHFDVFVF